MEFLEARVKDSEAEKVSGSWHVAFGSWHLALGIWLLAFGSWLLAVSSFGSHIPCIQQVEIVEKLNAEKERRVNELQVKC